MPDNEGYPTKDELKTVKNWVIERSTDFQELFDYVESIWHWRDYATRDYLKAELHTGGWSGNEEIVDTLKETWFWGICWVKSTRGGHYYFELPNPDTFDKEKKR